MDGFFFGRIRSVCFFESFVLYKVFLEIFSNYDGMERMGEKTQIRLLMMEFEDENCS